MPLFTLNSLSIISIEDSYPDSWRLFPEKAIFVESIGKVCLLLDWNVNGVHDHVYQLLSLKS